MLECVAFVQDLTPKLNMLSDEAFCAVVKIHKRQSNKIYISELTKIKIENQVKCKYYVDPQRIRSIHREKLKVKVKALTLTNIQSSVKLENHKMSEIYENYIFGN